VAAALLLATAPPTAAQARKVLASARCDACHDSGVSTENPRALAVYDLREDDWPARIPDERLPKLLGRLRSAPAADRGVVKRFIDAELRRRRTQPAAEEHSP
jgi:hypothetical protein